MNRLWLRLGANRSAARRRITTALALAVVATSMIAPGRAGAQPTQASPPPECIADDKGHVNDQACVQASAPGTIWQSLALINLGTQAYMRGDYASAERLYDEARPSDPSQKMYSDAGFHAFRAATYDHVGRDREALEDARTALALLRGERLPGMPPKAVVNHFDPRELYPLILPILKKAGDPKFDEALTAYLALPVDDWIAVSNRAALLDELGDHEAAATDAMTALRLAPGNPAVLNNACFILANDKRPNEALKFCEQALQAAPEVAAVHDSYATALSMLGRCTDANDQLAKARALDPVSKDYQRTLQCVAKSD